MKIILIAPIYFNYHQIIIDALKGQGHKVDFLADKNSGLRYTLSKKNKLLFDNYKNNYKNEIFKKFDMGGYDQLIVIGGKTLQPDFWELVKKKYSFKKTLYQWDSVQNFDYSKMIKSFDVTKTFDSQDAIKLKIPYLPLFYKAEKNAAMKLDIDLLFVGIWHSDRIDVLDQIIQFAKKNKLNYYVKLYYPKYLYLYLVYIKKLFAKSNLFIFKPINPFEMNSLYQRSKCVIDINHPLQTGLTMRTIETIGSGKKLITTNHFIKNEKFYNSKMIQVIDRKNVQIDDNFFKNNEVYENIDQLEINNWVLELL